MFYLLIKWLHVMAAIVAVGANVTYGVWLARASRQPDALPFTLRSIKFIDDRMANPAYGALLILGVILLLSGGLPLATPWLDSALVLYALVGLTAFLGYTPTLRRQIQALEADGFSSSAYQALARRGRLLGILLAILVVAIVFLMVVKPALWA